MLIKSLPDCDLIDTLKKKVKLRRDIDFDFFGTLNAFSKRVSNEVRFINELFPEYTPHDEEYHLKKLFYVADTILGKGRLESMNSVELFVLTLSMYGHDWGMALSSSEREYILNLKTSKSTKLEDIWILPDEHKYLITFLHNHHIVESSDGGYATISNEDWAEYVRETHALRSGERIRKYFKSIDGGIAESVARVCEGHWLDFEKLQNHKMFPVDFSVLRETINIRALSVYLRLIDLLDMAEDRTPYVIWKFVAPRNSISKMEWEKHRALRPITCPIYQEGRIIRVDGSTDDHEVYAALEDLKIWCEEQLKGSNDTLSLMNDPRHKLDIYHIDWRIAPRGFEPISIQFEFNRKRMFEILGDEIYQSDPYVFLRELLQNSIDAIRMRREVLSRNSISPENIGIIQVEVQHGENGDAVVDWRDDGIGMNEYVIRNYLAIAGNSYYRSLDFELEGLKMDPISKFGIGILSCFMVADRLEIETYREPYMPPVEQPLKIIIPSILRQFRIEKSTKEGSKVGTSIRVFVDGKKIPRDNNESEVEPINVTKYLSIIAGFVEFPILITERGARTIILHPKYDQKKILQHFGNDIQIKKIDLSYPSDQIFLPQDLSNASNLLKEQKWDINIDLKLEGYEGCISHLFPNCFELDFRKQYSQDGINTYSAELIERKEKSTKTSSNIVRWHNDITLGSKRALGISRSSTCSLLFAVFRDGILVPSISSPVEFVKKGKYYFDEWLSPRIVVNISKSIIPKIDLARKEIIGGNESWDFPLYNAYCKNIYESLIKDIQNIEPLERFYRLGHISFFHRIQLSSIWEYFPHEKWPMPFLDKGGAISFLEWGEILGDKIYLLPDIIEGPVIDLLRNKFFPIKTKGKKNSLSTWKGEKCLIHGAVFFNDSKAIGKALDIWELPLMNLYYFDSIRFLHPPWQNDPPIFQKILIQRKVQDKTLDDEKILEQASIDPAILSSEEKYILNNKFFTYRSGFSFPEFTNFPEPYSGMFGYGFNLLNFRHSITQMLIKTIS